MPQSFHLPAVISDWFTQRGWAPRRHQLEMLEAARAGDHTLLVAATGAGKTLAGFLPTLVDLADGGSAQVPGRSIAPAFRRDGAAPHPYLYFNHNHNRALRVGDWKILATGETGPWELYDLRTDRAEQHDLAAAQPERVKTMAAMWKERDDEFVRVRDAAPPSAKRRRNNRA